MLRASESPPHTGPRPGNHQKWGTACAECSTAKAKCLRSNTAPGSKCDRCHRLAKNCTEKAHRVRKKRQNKPSKTTQLEERLNNLIKELQQGGNEVPISFPSGVAPRDSQTPQGAIRSIPSSSTTTTPLSQHREAAHTEPQPVNAADLPHYGPTLIPNTYNCHGPSRCICRPMPGKAQGPFDSDEALLRIYREELMPSYPFVFISERTTAADLQSTRPFLLACIRMVASFHSMRSMQGQMYHLMSYIADHILIRSERSLDLLSGIVVIISWHNHHCFLHGQLQNLTSLAMTLVAELGLKRPPSWQERTRLMVINLGNVKERTNEERRLLLAVWHLSSCVSIGFQQLDPMRFSPYIQQCLRELEEANELDSDAYLVQLVKIQHLAERISCLDGRYDAEMEPGNLDKAPVSGYIFAFQAELDIIRKTMPRTLRNNKLMDLQMNTVRLRLYEPPRVDASLLASLSNSLTTSAPSPNVASPLDGFYRSHAALKKWFDDFLDYPVASYHRLTLPFAMNMIYATIILGRWAKLSGPGNKLSATPQPQDPSEFYNNPMREPLTPASSTLNDSPSSKGADQLASALARLQIQLTTQPALHLDVNGILGSMCDRLEQVSASLAGYGAREPNIWLLKATKLRIVQFKLQQWAELVAEGESDEEDGDEDARHDENDVVHEGGGGKDVQMPDPETYNMGLAGHQAEDVGTTMTGELEGMDSFMYTDDWGNWGFSFDNNGNFL